MYDVFISYRRDGGYAMARLLYEHLRAQGLNPFFDLEELRSGPFNVKLYEAIEESENFLLVLPVNSLNRCVEENDWLRLEIQHAIKYDKNIIPAMMNGFSWPDNMVDSIKKLSSYNGVLLSRDYFDASVQKIISMLRGVNLGSSGDSYGKKVVERRENKYFSSDDKKEVKRLKIQQNLMKQFDQPIYDKVVKGETGVRVLDIGSNNGDFVMDRIGNRCDMEKLIGLECDEKAVDTANKKYGEEGKIAFYCCNVEAEDFEEQLEEIMDAQNIEAFDVINISMVLLHLKGPYKLVKTLRRFLRKGGTIIIKDIDDGYNVAYPDPQEEFSRVVRICSQNETAGFRHSGRQVYTLLKRAGYQEVCLEKLGLSTIGMDFDERSALFDTYFSFIVEDLKIMVERYPSKTEIRQDLEWYKDTYESLEQQFQDEAFYFNLGFVLFTAKK